MSPRSSGVAFAVIQWSFAGAGGEVTIHAQNRQPIARLLAELAEADVAAAMDAVLEPDCHRDFVCNIFHPTRTRGDLRAVLAARRAKAESPAETQASFAEAPSPAAA